MSRHARYRPSAKPLAILTKPLQPPQGDSFNAAILEQSVLDLHHQARICCDGGRGIEGKGVLSCANPGPGTAQNATNWLR